MIATGFEVGWPTRLLPVACSRSDRLSPGPPPISTNWFRIKGFGRFGEGVNAGSRFTLWPLLAQSGGVLQFNPVAARPARASLVWQGLSRCGLVFRFTVPSAGVQC
jgi:hypothetical protein